MAAMFYSLQEAAGRLNKTEEELREIVRAGKLREFRDGPNVLFKVGEVEALMSDTSVMGAPEAPAPQVPEAEISLEMEAPEPKIPEPVAPEVETPLEMEAAELEIPEPVAPELEIPSELETPQAEAPEPEIPEPVVPELEIPEPAAPELEIPSEPETPQAEAPPQPQAGTSEILLAPETGAPVPPSELTDADTAITGEGISVLGETDKDYEITDDTLSETVGTLGTTGTTPEASLEEIEGDVNLDSFGSGSGLLDLSLQADDTSLGGIIDEIYTAEDESTEPAEAGTVEEVVAEADQIEEDLVARQVMPGLVQARFEPAPDKASNILGALLFLPLLLVLYTAIVAIGGLKGVVPSVLTGIQGFIWYVMGGFVAAALAVGGWAFMADRELTPAAKKPQKAKKPKKAKKGKKPPSPTPEDSVA
ncbi:MAG: hypothetical protein KAY65_08520 [Planctomycetes bacterium]|nr:hypothetical protein [Planctomycetota bacterium]